MDIVRGLPVVHPCFISGNEDAQPKCEDIMGEGWTLWTEKDLETLTMALDCGDLGPGGGTINLSDCWGLTVYERGTGPGLARGPWWHEVETLAPALRAPDLGGVHAQGAPRGSVQVFSKPPHLHRHHRRFHPPVLAPPPRSVPLAARASAPKPTELRYEVAPTRQGREAQQPGWSAAPVGLHLSQ